MSSKNGLNSESTEKPQLMVSDCANKANGWTVGIGTINIEKGKLRM